MPDRILLEGIQVPARLGTSKEERELQRPVRVDLSLEMPLARPGRSDRLCDTVDYVAVHRTVERLAAGDHQLVEALAEEIAAALLESFPIDRCRVTVRKQAPLAGVAERAGVRIVRARA
ncbi:MAG: dihydroneopterin aldolase [Myxococcota bacterium]